MKEPKRDYSIWLVLIAVSMLIWYFWGLDHGKKEGIRLANIATQPLLDKAAEKIVELEKSIREKDNIIAESERLLTETGYATFYGDECAGLPTSNGESFCPEGLTAATWTWPIGTRLRVTSVETRRDVVVRVNDRGPHPRIWLTGVIIDLSLGAARELGMVADGRHKVVVTPVLRGTDESL